MKNGYEEEWKMVNGIYGDVNHEVLKALNSIIKVAYEDGYKAGKANKDAAEKYEEFAQDIGIRQKSPNQQRAELIQRAREFVENKSTSHVNEGVISFWPKGMKNKYFLPSHEVEFVINKSKRTVVCLIKGLFCRSVRYRGIAKCHPNEVFNADIGKAIALARALEIDVPQEFLQAVQPSHYALGQVVRVERDPFNHYRKYRVDRIGKGTTLSRLWEKGTAECNTTTSLDYEDEDIKALQVIDDTNAIYEEESK